MPYKDKGLRAEAVRRHREKQGGITSGITVTKERAIKLLRIASFLDREITGLGSKKENMLDLVRYGAITMREVQRQLTA